MAQSLLIAGRYLLLRSLVEGRTDRVWLAHDRVMDRKVTIKRLTPPPGLTPQEREILQSESIREVRAIGRLNDPHTIHVFDLITPEEGDPWIVMEYIPGRSLSDAVETSGTLPPQIAAAIGLDILSSMRAAHEAGVSRRTINPGNVQLADNGCVVLTDVGTASISGDPYVTQIGLLLGSPAYVAPERAQGAQVGQPADLWSLGATLYHAVEGHPPFQRDTAADTLAALLTDPVPPARHAGPLAEVLMGGLLQKDPAQRPDVDALDPMLREIVDQPQSSTAQTVLLPSVPPTQSTVPMPTVPMPTVPMHPRSRRRTPRFMWLILVFAVLVPAIAVIASRHGTARRIALAPTSADPSNAARSSAAVPSPTRAKRSAASPKASPTGFKVPAGWQLRDDGTGFKVPVPNDWQFGRDKDGRALWQDRGTGRLLLIDQTRRPKPDPLQDWQNNERARRGSYPDYQRIRLERVSYWDSAADWEFTYTLNGTKVHVLNRNFITAPDQAYSIYWRTPEQTWRDNLDGLHIVLGGFVPR